MFEAGKQNSRKIKGGAGWLVRAIKQEGVSSCKKTTVNIREPTKSMFFSRCVPPPFNDLPQVENEEALLLPVPRRRPIASIPHLKDQRTKCRDQKQKVPCSFERQSPGKKI